MTEHAIVIGGGLAGCEAAWQLAGAGIAVTLYEMKPHRYSPAHHHEGLAELVCSNSLKASRLGSAGGLLKTEMEMQGSLLVRCAKACAVAAGGALAVDREQFSAMVTQEITSHPLITVIREELTALPERNAVIATGPLTSDALAAQIEQLCGSRLSFFDAAAPVVAADSLDQALVFAQSRYDRGDADYLNCPMNKEEYEAFWEALVHAEKAPLHEHDKAAFRVYEGCMPVEVLASRGIDTLRYGPLKPVGLRDPRTDRRPYAAVQLRRENKEGTMFNLVGFQTNLKFGEQKRVFGMIPGLQNAEFLRYGVMHRNFFLDSPRLLDADYSLRGSENLFFAGQMTGVEGYMESAASGIIAGKSLARRLQGKTPYILPKGTMMGALADYVSGGCTAEFQPMGANMGLLPPLTERVRDKQLRYLRVAEQAVSVLEKALAELEKE
ncbi:MAG: methylenetetrahydrofolate--tRNA-(uracil(54)-C(5))-methyltransferase (FADH(2)-oxidizing) TrmFO [Oscillospiraceae bacterium]|nr:methylenetetrahydrofolate--tRNA-(uracil(54)-C(5))-methyltransferase (FADH(2)-oxidizing) TrmFO [Oscillospiraceae bacterium]MBQ7013218.1 methylenetetrahydrofolate--tRNA-(uracil(54)-C(5))-methyltransferase (FADH(2)-oxidizing) TrmFO [Oscillospiraceae bacterium]